MPWQKSGNDDVGGVNPRLFSCRYPDRAQRKSPPAPLYPAMQGMALVGFQLCGLSVVCGLCRASIFGAGLAGCKGTLRRCGACGYLLPVCRDFPVVRPLRFRGLTCNSRQPCASGCGFPCALCIPALSPGFYGGTAPPGVAEYVNNGGKHHAICETCHSEC